MQVGETCPNCGRGKLTFDNGYETHTYLVCVVCDFRGTVGKITFTADAVLVKAETNK